MHSFLACSFHNHQCEFWVDTNVAYETEKQKWTIVDSLIFLISFPVQFLQPNAHPHLHVNPYPYRQIDLYVIFINT